MSNMSRWRIKSVSAESRDLEPEYWEAVVELEHTGDRRRLQVELSAEVRCNITLDCDEIGFEGFLSDADADFEHWLSHYAESGDFTEEEVSCALGRDYWAFFSSSTVTAIVPDSSACHRGECEEVLSGAFNIDYNGEAFDASGWLTDGLESAIERALKAAARNEVAYPEYWAEAAYGELIEHGEHIEL